MKMLVPTMKASMEAPALERKICEALFIGNGEINRRSVEGESGSTGISIGASARGEADWGAAGVGAVADECQRKLGKEEEKRALVVTSCEEKEADDCESDGRSRNPTGEATTLFVVSTIEETEHRFDGYEAVIEEATVAAMSVEKSTASKGSRTTGTTNDERGWKITTERDQ
ncbi:hypothetical protein B296_00026480 [Ensete ventricosum]|uniref:Uncharacterized protein n=1 Tax=Ensete ventricosum TaxID=4639 RepID=A0A427AKR0_ENSVE|nr:hypothetical protein B296_00026480 [Ensete ventricosum]